MQLRIFTCAEINIPFFFVINIPKDSIKLAGRGGTHLQFLHLGGGGRRIASLRSAWVI